MAEGESAKRQVAHKVRISDILNNRYVKEEGWLPNYILVHDKKISRANIIGVIVSKDADDGQSPSFMLDDGTGRLSLRFFEHGAELSVGDIVGVIGRPREFGAERYLVPEVIKKISDSRWVEIRKLELALERQNTKPAAPSETAADVLDAEEEIVEASNPLSQIADIIKREDSGGGVSFEEITVKFSGNDPEEYVKRLLEQGDIFEVKPGRYKVLE